MSKKLLALLLALVMIVGSFTSVLADPAKEPVKEDKKTEEKAEEKKEEPAKTEEKKDEKSEEKKDEKSEEKKEEKKEEVKDEALLRAQEVLKKAGIISGYSKDSEDFKAEKNVTRAEFASMIVRALNLEASAKSLATVPTGFKDVPTNLWANGYIAVAKQQGIINGYPNGTFQPNRQISYQDMATMLTIALGKAEVGTVYPAGYIVKAQQLGLFNNVEVPAYTDMATRGNVFKMVYNMVTSKEFGQRKIVKAIVIENYRVEKLESNQITVEVLSLVQKADWVDKNRGAEKKGDQHTYTLSAEAKADPEQLLGKVVDLTLDKDDKIVELKVDNNFEYLEGKINAVTAKKLVLNNTTYSAAYDERYENRDERIYRTYLNNSDMQYIDFAHDFEKSKYDFARITVKNGKVIFIDAYQFDDIAPVSEVKDNDVWYYDDDRNARLVKTNPDKFPDYITLKSNGVYSVGEVKDIAKDDVIHFYNNYSSAIVRKDAKIETELTKTHINKWDKETVVGKDGEYWLRNTDKFRAIYSFEGKEFETVANRGNLYPIEGRKVKLLVALDNSVQLVASDLAWNDGVQAIKKITSYGEVNLLPAAGEAFWAKEGRNTRYFAYKEVNNSQLKRCFDVNDIVYFAGETAKDSKDQSIKHMVQILDYKNDKDADFVAYRYGSKKNPVVTNNEHFELASIDSRYIEVGNKKLTRAQYRYFEGIHAYYIDKKENIRQVGDMGKFIAQNAKNKDLKAIVYSEGDLNELLNLGYGVPTYNFLSPNKKIAKIVVFKDAKVSAGVDTIYAEVTDSYGWTNAMRFVDAQGNVYIVNIRDDYKEGIDPREVKSQDIVELRILKDTADKEVKEGFIKKIAIYRNDKKVFIKDKKFDRAYSIDGKDKYFDKDTQIFNKQLGDYVQVYYENQEDPKDGDPNVVRVIRYFEEGAAQAERFELGRIYSNTNQFEVIQVGKPNRFYKISRNTRFITVDEDGRIVKDYGWFQTPMEEFHKDFEGKFVEVVEDPTNPNFAIEVRGLVDGPSSEAEDAVLKAKKVIEELGKQLYDLGETGQVAKFQAKVNEALKNEGLDKLVKATVADTAATAKDPVHFTTKIESKEQVVVTPAVGATPAVMGPKATDKAKNYYSMKTQVETDEANQDLLKAMADALDQETFSLGYEYNESLAKAVIKAFLLKSVDGEDEAQVKVNSLTLLTGPTAVKDDNGNEIKDLYEVEIEYSAAKAPNTRKVQVRITK